MSRHTRIALVLLLAALSGALAHAQDASVRERAEASFRAGAAAYAAGEYLAAIQALQAAYELTPLPAIAFSLAQAERRQYFVAREPGHLERAIALYREYVRAVPSGGRRADAVDALVQLEPLAAASAGQSTGGTAQPAPAATRLLVSSEAPGATIALDAMPAVPSPLIREVEPGTHHARVEADGFFPAERELMAVQGELIMGEVSLRERPSTLQLATPADADVYLDGSFVAQGGAKLKLELLAGTHRLAVGAKGSRTEYRSLTLARGQTETLKVTLTRTPQRKAARGLFVAGGAVLATGIVLGGLAIHEEQQAQDFLAKREHRNVSSAELNDYQDHTERRDLYRTLAFTGVGAAVALFTTALLLRELDRPSSRDIQRDARSVAPSAARDAGGPSTAPPLALAPWLHKGVLGAAVRRAF
jgi:tetratricopeptide (TPR) repeat protein